MHYKKGDIVCFQITSNKNQVNLLKLDNEYFNNKPLVLESYVKYDKCFTLNNEIVDKKVAEITSNFLIKVKKYFCDELF
jgi:hypothetical protein